MRSLYTQSKLSTVCALALMLGVGACSSQGRDRLPDVSGSAGAGSAVGTAGSAGTSGTLNGAGGYGFVDDRENPATGGVPGSGGDGLDAGATDPYVLPPSIVFSDAGVVLCGTEPCACNNGVDDDGDGKGDGFDEECTGALDDDEGTFSTGIPGDNSDPKWQDCFYDGNSGAGDDHCRYHVDCLTGVKPASDPDCAVSEACHDFCEVRTPNGCDCFGCCAVQLEDGSSVSVFIGESCSLENVGNAELCTPCTPSTECGNPCGECELCPGKGIEDLPESCGTSTGGSGGTGSEPPTYTCDAGRTVCADASQCAGGQYCSLGCCLDFMIQ